jgi:hypothetical protein
VRKLMLTGALSALLLGASATSASADTWSGDCTFHGTSRFLNPYTVVPAYRNYQGRGTGTCKGTLNGAAFQGPASVYMDGRMNAPMSCESGLGLNVPTTVTFGRSPNRVRARRVRMLMNESHVLTQQLVHLVGAYNGQAYGHLVFLANGSDLQNCFTSNINRLGIDLDIHTIQRIYG